MQRTTPEAWIARRRVVTTVHRCLHGLGRPKSFIRFGLHDREHAMHVLDKWLEFVALPPDQQITEPWPFRAAGEPMPLTLEGDQMSVVLLSPNACDDANTVWEMARDFRNLALMPRRFYLKFVCGRRADFALRYRELTYTMTGPETWRRGIKTPGAKAVAP